MEEPKVNKLGPGMKVGQEVELQLEPEQIILNVRGKALEILVNHGLPEVSAKEVLTEIDLGLRSGRYVGSVDWCAPNTVHSPSYYLLMTKRLLAAAALRWIDKNEPDAWYREMFVYEN